MSLCVMDNARILDWFRIRYKGDEVFAVFEDGTFTITQVGEIRNCVNPIKSDCSFIARFKMSCDGKLILDKFRNGYMYMFGFDGGFFNMVLKGYTPVNGIEFDSSSVSICMTSRTARLFVENKSLRHNFYSFIDIGGGSLYDELIIK